MTKVTATTLFKEYCLHKVPFGDICGLNQAWNDHVDALQKGGEVTEHQATTWIRPFITQAAWLKALRASMDSAY